MTDLTIPPPPREPATRELSPREREIIAAVALGHSNGAIAEAMNISIRTVDQHKYNICRKLGVKGSVALAREALKRGWVTL